MSEYASLITLDIDGEQIEDFESFDDKSVELAAQINLMNKTGTASKTPRYTFALGYVKPKGRPEFDFAGLINGVVSIEEEDGSRTVYTGVRTLTIGDASRKSDGSGVIRTIDFHADAKEGI